MYPPHAKLTRLVDAAVEPLSLASARNYLRVESYEPEEDALISDLITAARMVCEQEVDRSFITTKWRLTLDYLPFSDGSMLASQLFGWGRSGAATIQLPAPPLIALTAIRYRDLAGVVDELDVSPNSSQVIATAGTPGRITPGYGTFFPFARPTIGAVEIEYTAGYGSTPASVPKNIVQAIRMLVSHYYEHRSSQAEIPDAVANLLAPAKWGGYA